MALPGNIKDREHRKFKDKSGDGKITAVYVTADEGDLPVSGTIIPSGAQNFIEMAEIELNTTTWVELTAGFRSTRNGLSVMNRSNANPTGVGDIVVNGSNAAGSLGEIIHANDLRDYTISDIPVYGKTLTGGTFKVVVTEIG